jgi:tripartite-type tricarboxylate transporter receptor subunit TctC
MRDSPGKTIILFVAALIFGVPAVSMAQTAYKAKPVRLIVPMPPGGSNDILARMIGQRLSEVVGQSVVIDNRPGAGGEIGVTMAAHAAPDGNTLMLGSLGNLAHNPALKPDIPYDPVRDFAPVTLLATTPFILVVNRSLPVTTVKELLDLARAKPGALNYASAGQGSSPHMTTEYFKHVTKIDIVHVAYKGGAPALTELIAGQTQLCFIALPAAISHVKAAKLRAVAMTSAKRVAVLPDVPTVTESGVDDFVVENWQGIVVPRQTPVALVQRLHQDLFAAMKRPGMNEGLNSQGLEASTCAPEVFGKLIRSEFGRYRQVVKAANIRVE